MRRDEIKQISAPKVLLHFGGGWLLGQFAASGFFLCASTNGEELAKRAQAQASFLPSTLSYFLFCFISGSLIYRYFHARRTKYRWLLIGMRVGFLCRALASVYTSLIQAGILMF